MSNKVLIAGVLLAAGSIAAISSPDTVRDATARLLEAFDQYGEAGSGRYGARHREMAEGEDASDRPARRRYKGGDAERDGFTRSRREHSRTSEVDDGDGDPSLGARLERLLGGRGSHAGGREDSDGAGHGRHRRDDAEPRRGAAERSPVRADRSFARLDQNGDGMIDARDFQARAAQIVAAETQRFMKRFDADGDGRVSREEFGRATAGPREPRDHIADLDIEGDHTVGDADAPWSKRGHGILK
jgi:EF-hand domain pair